MMKSHGSCHVTTNVMCIQWKTNQGMWRVPIFIVSPKTIMRIKTKPIKKNPELPTDEELASNLDPTTNDQLVKDLFEKLKKRIGKQTRK